MNCKGEMLGSTCYETKLTYAEEVCGSDTVEIDFTNQKDLYYLKGMQLILLHIAKLIEYKDFSSKNEKSG